MFYYIVFRFRFQYRHWHPAKSYRCYCNKLFVRPYLVPTLQTFLKLDTVDPLTDHYFSPQMSRRARGPPCAGRTARDVVRRLWLPTALLRRRPASPLPQSRRTTSHRSSSSSRTSGWRQTTPRAAAPTPRASRPSRRDTPRPARRRRAPAVRSRRSRGHRRPSRCHPGALPSTSSSSCSPA